MAVGGLCLSPRLAPTTFRISYKSCSEACLSSNASVPAACALALDQLFVCPSQPGRGLDFAAVSVELFLPFWRTALRVGDMSSRMAWPTRPVKWASSSGEESVDKPQSDELTTTDVYIEDTRAASLVATLRSMRDDEQLCDVTLEAGGVRLFAHRAVLAASSPYFRCMFASGLSETRQDTVHLRDMDGHVLEAIVDFFYGAQLQLRDLDLEETLRVSSMLQLPGVREATAEQLQKTLCPANCLGMRSFASAHGARRLEMAAEAYSRRHFDKVVQAGEEFFAQGFDDLERLVSSDRLNVRGEEQVYEALMAWTEHDVEQRAELLPRLLAKVRRGSWICDRSSAESFRALFQRKTDHVFDR